MQEFFLRLNDKLALGADDRQWILMRASENKATGGLNWTHISFVSSTKRILERCVPESGYGDVVALTAIEVLPRTFKEWKTAAAKVKQDA